MSFYDFMKNQEDEDKQEREIQRIVQKEIRNYFDSAVCRLLIRDIVTSEFNMPEVQLLYKKNLQDQMVSQINQLFGIK